MLDIMQLWPDRGDFGGILQDVVVKVFVVVDLVDELVDTWWKLCRATLERLWANYLAIVDDQLLVEGCYRDQYWQQRHSLTSDVPYFCISIVSAASVSLIRSRRPETACGRAEAKSSLR